MNTKLDFKTIDMLSKGITQYAFRSEPVEEMQAKNKLTQKGMKTLNKYMTNHIARTANSYIQWQYRPLKLLTFFALSFSDWDSAKSDTENFYL